MRYALGMVAGGLAGALSAPLGAIVALGIAATSDISGLTLLLSLGGVLGVLPLVALIGLVLGMVVGAVTAALGGR
ncbi:MAG: hypothetical protein M3P51_19240 [Chloroflexota bacterium]|nr:hypothetical protein [Chloroflexota bacterium]